MKISEGTLATERKSLELALEKDQFLSRGVIVLAIVNEDAKATAKPKRLKIRTISAVSGGDLSLEARAEELRVGGCDMCDV